MMEDVGEDIEEALGFLFEDDDDEEEELVLSMGHLGGNNPDPPEVDDRNIWERDISDTLAERDERIRETEASSGHEEVRTLLRESGDAEAIAEQLEELTETETMTHARTGSTLDMRNTIRRLAGDSSMQELYRRETTEPGDDLAICLSLDMSGSMGGDELEAKAGVGGFLHGVQEHTRHDVAANAWYEWANEATVELITGPQEDFRWSHLDAVWPGGGTPTAAGIDEASILLRQMQADVRLLVVVTDGTPSNVSWKPDEYDDPVAESEAVVDDVRDRGIDVIGLGFGHVSESRMTDIFGDAGRAVTVETLPDHLMDILEGYIDS